MNNTTLLRPGWTPVTIALMVLGFVSFWPLGLMMLAYILWGEKMSDFKSEVRGAKERFFPNLCNSSRDQAFNFNGDSGNTAFDEWRAKELKRLNEERQKLDALRDDFDKYSQELRRAKDQEEFEHFMAARNNNSSPITDIVEESVTTSHPL